jgi:hypothetical protein
LLTRATQTKIGVKAALRLLARDLGPCRGPIGDPPAEKMEAMKRMLRAGDLALA